MFHIYNKEEKERYLLSDDEGSQSMDKVIVWHVRFVWNDTGRETCCTTDKRKQIMSGQRDGLLVYCNHSEGG